MVTDNIHNALWLKTPVQANGSVDIVGDDFKLQGVINTGKLL